jgi:hypothetical protein
MLNRYKYFITMNYHLLVESTDMIPLIALTFTYSTSGWSTFVAYKFHPLIFPSDISTQGIHRFSVEALIGSCIPPNH